MLDTGDAGWVAFDSNDPLTMYHTYVYAQANAIFRSSNGGAPDGWQAITNGIEPDPSEFYLPMAIDRTTDPNTLYLGTYRLYKTTDRGDTWNVPSPGLSLLTNGQPPNDCFSGECITAIAVAPSDGNYVYVGTNFGHVYVSSDGGTTFTEADQGLPNLAITKIAVDPTDSQGVWVAFLEFQGPRVVLSGDAGGTWFDVSSDLPKVPVTALLLDTHGSAYVGIDTGVYVSASLSLSNLSTETVSWSKVGTGLPEIDVRDLTFDAKGTLIAATYGRGIWALDSPSQGQQTQFSLGTSSLNNPILIKPALASNAAYHQLERGWVPQILQTIVQQPNFLPSVATASYSHRPDVSRLLNADEENRTLHR